MLCDSNYGKNIVANHIPAGVSAINFNLTPEQIKALKGNGAKAAQAFFQSTYGPDSNQPIQRENTFPVVVPPGRPFQWNLTLILTVLPELILWL